MRKHIGLVVALSLWWALVGMAAGYLLSPGVNASLAAEQADQAIALLQSCQARYDELAGGRTLIYESKSVGVQILDGLIEIKPGERVPLPLFEQSAARWYIPARVTPIVYGDAGSTSYLWYNTGTGEWSGPFQPKGAQE
ncbi:MAG: hypothetical protein L0212_04080 [Acidobacteria bacterium]|nr:hypothetical protein [Acidobacteriota bacterium]